MAGAQQKPPGKGGLLDKYSPALFRSWQTRTCEVKDRILKYSKEKNGKLEMCGVLNFDLYCCYVQKIAGKPQFKITFKGNEREFWFRGASEEDASAWVEVLTQHI